MSDVAARRAAAPPRLIGRATAAVLVAVGVVSFVATLLLGAYAPDLRIGGGTGGHALSDAAIGYGGLVRLAEETGRRPRVVRDVHALGTEDLVVATPEEGSVPVGPVLNPRGSTPTLIVLPKWLALPDRRNRGWVNILGLKGGADPRAVLAPAATLDVIERASGGRPLATVEPGMKGVAFAAPQPLQAIRPARRTGGNAGWGDLQPLVVDEAGNIVVGRFANRPLYVLADPDLFDNRGVHDARTAASALAMLDWMNSNEAGGIAFDVTLNGLGRRANPLKLLFEPPFVAMTLSLAAALLLAALGTIARFGSPRPRERAIAFGKAALVDNTAALVRKAEREARLGRRYVEVVREAAVRAFAVPARLKGEAVDAYLDRLGRSGSGGERFTTLAGAVVRAASRDELVGAARALHDWMKNRSRA